MEKYGKPSVYALRDPRTGIIRYVGRSVTPQQRYKMHINTARRGTGRRANKKLLEWINSLFDELLEPEFVILEMCSSEEELNAREIVWIRRLRELGVPLLNIKVGGQAASGWKKSEESKVAHSAGNRKRFSDPDQRTNHSKSAKKRWSDENERIAQSLRMVEVQARPEVKAKISEALKGRVFSEETKQRMSASAKRRAASVEFRRASRERMKKLRSEHPESAFKGRTHSEETKAKQSSTQKGRSKSDETRRRMSEAQKKRHAKKKQQP